VHSGGFAHLPLSAFLRSSQPPEKLVENEQVNACLVCDSMRHNEDGVLAGWHMEPELAQGLGHAQLGFQGVGAAPHAQVGEQGWPDASDRTDYRIEPRCVLQANHLLRPSQTPSSSPKLSPSMKVTRLRATAAAVADSPDRRP
jgi:hypothetical protein